MMFLLNDVVLHVDSSEVQPPVDARQFEALTLNSVIQLGAELFSEDPLLHQNNPARAKRLAALILAKAPSVNAALFIAPAKGCPANQVQSRYVQIDLSIMGSLYSRQREGNLTTVQADKEVWRRLAA